MKMKRVLVINHFAAPRESPGGTRHVELFGQLNDWAYLIVSSRLNLITGEPQEDQPGFCFVRVPPYKGNGLGRVANWATFAVAATSAGIRQSDVDIVYASSPHLLAALAGWAVAKIKRARLIVEVRDLWPQVLVDMKQIAAGSILHRLLSALEGFLYRGATAIVVLSPGVSEQLGRDNRSRTEIAYIPNAADPDDFAMSAPRDELRRRYGFERPTAIYAGAHGPANGLELLLRAAKATADLGLQIVLLGDGVEKERLRAEARALGLDNVRFMSPIAKSEMADVLGAADLGLHVLADVPLFRYGVSPNKVFDYMACGLPILTNCPGVVGDIVDASGSGWVVEADELAQGLRAAFSYSEPIRREYGINGREWIRAHNSRRSTARSLEALLDRVINIQEPAK